MHNIVVSRVWKPVQLQEFRTCAPRRPMQWMYIKVVALKHPKRQTQSVLLILMGKSNVLFRCAERGHRNRGGEISQNKAKPSAVSNESVKSTRIGFSKIHSNTPYDSCMTSSFRIGRLPGVLLLSLRQSRIVVTLSPDRSNIEDVIRFMRRNDVDLHEYECGIVSHRFRHRQRTRHRPVQGTHLHPHGVRASSRLPGSNGLLVA